MTDKPRVSTISCTEKWVETDFVGNSVQDFASTPGISFGEGQSCSRLDTCMSIVAPINDTSWIPDALVPSRVFTHERITSPCPRETRYARRWGSGQALRTVRRAPFPHQTYLESRDRSGEQRMLQELFPEGKYGLQCGVRRNSRSPRLCIEASAIFDHYCSER